MSGHLFPDAMPISHDEWLSIESVVIDVLLGAGVEDVVPVGSMPFNRLHGDVDLAVKHPSGRDGLARALEKGFQTRVTGNDLVSIRYPVRGFKWVQIDLMVGNPTFLQWSRAGSANPLLRGADRALFINAVLRPEMLPDAEFRSRLAVDFGSGLYVIQQTRKGAKGRLKDWKTYERKFLTDEPDQVAQRIFGGAATGSSTRSFEGCLSAFRASPKFSEAQRNQVLTGFLTEFNEQSILHPGVHGSVAEVERLLNI